MEIRESSILLLSHISDLSGPTEALENFLISKKVSVCFLVYNPLEYCSISKRVSKLYINGDIIKKIQPANIKLGRLLTWITDFVISVYYSFKSKYKYGAAICCDGLNVIIGLLLRKFGRCKKVIFYFIDWTPIRFNNKLLNAIYQKITDFSIRHADIVWCVSKRLSELQVGKGISSDKIQHVPVGVSSNCIKTSNENSDYKALVFLGALERTKGIDLVIDSWPYLIKKDPQFKLIVIGKTPGNSRYYENILETFQNVQVLGVLSHDEVLSVLPKYGIGLAPYAPSNSSVSFYGDPSRIKDYLVCGLPIIVTSIPEISLEIEKNNAGKIVNYSIQDLINGIMYLTQNKDVFYRCRYNAKMLAERYKWDNIFSEALDKISV